LTAYLIKGSVGLRHRIQQPTTQPLLLPNDEKGYYVRPFFEWQ